MEITLSSADAAFQSDVRSFIEAALPGDIKSKVELGQHLEKDDYVRWHKILHTKGWAAPAWPVEYGGTDWTPLQRHLFEEELARASTPRLMPFGLSMVAPVIMAFGDAAQKQHFLPRILSCEDWWCQGYSEPGAGSDLASLTTKAVPDGTDYIVSGAKTWTTLAQYADMIFCLVRTSSEGKPQTGISFLLIDMHSPGITVRPIRTMDGGYEVNDVFFDEVRVPQANRVGEENKGWTYAKFLLGHERTGIAAIGRSKQELRQLKVIAAAEAAGDGSLAEDGAFAGKMADLEIDILALESLVLKIVADEAAGRTPGAEASILKIRGTEIQQRLSELALEAIGYYANPYIAEAQEAGWNEPPVGPEYAATVAPHYFNWRKASIYGGTNEIQKNIIAKMVLGL
ncbi:MAG: pimeloyl-CoA dehydrogenase large subunit [Rhodospirillaceae bacterium]|nr:pimeloyl-CoA dehydrogenase large subunit [Rhodospirillaceae bacterium]MBT3928233.1 pimeloyl-CoA dehydrogenase large subunit [Rhodospirillaceae bacterium]MBT5674535.1 pimeloyl-CoA dehydrogenase large subunit [Rhodospirillaceae bacterium]MBT6828622.1 pimeloyl-CoA dehydrogenase large subunit [Rhodospirillaceae bacterium]